MKNASRLLFFFFLNEIVNYTREACVYKTPVPNLKSPRSPWWDRRGGTDTLFPTGAHEWRLTESHLRGTSLKPRRIRVCPRRSGLQQHGGFRSSAAEMRCALPRLRCLPSSSHRATVTTGATPLLLFSALWLYFKLRAGVCPGGSSPPGGPPLPCRVSKTQSSVADTSHGSTTLISPTTLLIMINKIIDCQRISNVMGRN